MSTQKNLVSMSFLATCFGVLLSWVPQLTYAQVGTIEPELTAVEREAYILQNGIMTYTQFSDVLGDFAPVGIIKEIGPSNRPIVRNERAVYIEPSQQKTSLQYFVGSYEESIKANLHLDASAMVMKNVPLFYFNPEAALQAIKTDRTSILIDVNSDKTAKTTGWIDPRQIRTYEGMHNRQKYIFSTGMFELLARFISNDGLVGTIYKRKCE